MCVLFMEELKTDKRCFSSLGVSVPIIGSGGPSFRQIKDVNIALLTKMGWWWLHEDYELWARALSTKYLRGNRTVCGGYCTNAS